jgi:hypothetical protein
MIRKLGSLHGPQGDRIKSRVISIASEMALASDRRS